MCFTRQDGKIHRESVEICIKFVLKLSPQCSSRGNRKRVLWGSSAHNQRCFNPIFFFTRPTKRPFTFSFRGWEEIISSKISNGTKLWNGLLFWKIQSIGGFSSRTKLHIFNIIFKGDSNAILQSNFHTKKSGNLTNYVTLPKIIFPLDTCERIEDNSNQWLTKERVALAWTGTLNTIYLRETFLVTQHSKSGNLVVGREYSLNIFLGGRGRVVSQDVTDSKRGKQLIEGLAPHLQKFSKNITNIPNIRISQISLLLRWSRQLPLVRGRRWWMRGLKQDQKVRGLRRWHLRTRTQTASTPAQIGCFR